MSLPKAHEKDWWLGPEVEGQIAHTRALTAIVRRPPKHRADLLNAGIEHLFLTEDFDAWDWLEDFACLFHGTMAIGVHHYDIDRLSRVNQLSCRRRLRVLLRYFSDAPNTLGMLYAHDEVSVGEPFNLMTFPVPAGVRTFPDQYKDDR